MWPFKRKRSTPESYPPDPWIDEIAETVWGEFDREAERQASRLDSAVLSPLASSAAIEGLRKRKADRPDERST
jgi:hypothetical protein